MFNEKNESSYQHSYTQSQTYITNLVSSKMPGVRPIDVGILGIGGKIPPNNTSPEIMFKFLLEDLNNGLIYPEKVKQSFIIEVEDEVIYHVSEGQVTTDRLDLANHFKQNFQNNSEEIYVGQLREFINDTVVKDIIKDITGLIQITRQMHGDEEMEFESQKYNFSLHNNNLSVCKKSGEEILNNFGFTESATRKDVQEMVDLSIKTKTVQDDSFTPKEETQPKPKL